MKSEKLQKQSPDTPSLEIAREGILSSLRPVVIYGHGVTLGNAHAELEDFLDKSGIPAVWTFLGIGGVDETKPRRYGMLGMHGTMVANFSVHNADLIIGIGIRFDDRIYGKLTEFQKDKHIIHFDIDPSEFGKNVKNYASIVGNVKETLPEVTKLLSISPEKRVEWDRWNTKIQHVDTENPLEKNDGLCHCEERSNPCSTCSRFTQVSVIDMLYEVKDECDVVIVDVGQHQMWAAQRFRSKYPRTFHGSGGLGTMGFSLPTAIGACYGISSLEPTNPLTHHPTIWSIS